MTATDVYAALTADPSSAPVWADWFEETGDRLTALQLRYGPPPLGLAGDGYGYGDGSGYGHGDGSGSGDGYGHGDGYGDGDGSGSGSGYGHGDGDGPSVITAGLTGVSMPEVGKTQLIVLPHGWVFVGRVAEQTGPYTFRVTDAVNVVRTGGTPWPDLCDGKGRAGARFRRWGDIHVGPQFVVARDWAGGVPAGDQ